MPANPLAAELRSALNRKSFEKFDILMKDGKFHRITRMAQPAIGNINVIVLQEKPVQFHHFTIGDGVQIKPRRSLGAARGKSR